MNVLFAPEVEEDLYELIEVLVEKEYLGTHSFAISYVEELITDIQQNIFSKLKKKAPVFFERYGKDMYYITYQRNYNTTWYIFFSIRGITNISDKSNFKVYTKCLGNQVLTTKAFCIPFLGSDFFINSWKTQSDILTHS